MSFTKKCHKNAVCWYTEKMRRKNVYHEKCHINVKCWSAEKKMRRKNVCHEKYHAKCHENVYCWSAEKNDTKKCHENVECDIETDTHTHSIKQFPIPMSMIFYRSVTDGRTHICTSN